MQVVPEVVTALPGQERRMPSKPDRLVGWLAGLRAASAQANWRVSPWCYRV